MVRTGSHHCTAFTDSRVSSAGIRCRPYKSTSRSTRSRDHSGIFIEASGQDRSSAGTCIALIGQSSPPSCLYSLSKTLEKRRISRPQPGFRGRPDNNLISLTAQERPHSFFLTPNRTSAACNRIATYKSSLQSPHFHRRALFHDLLDVPKINIAPSNQSNSYRLKSS